MPARSSTASPLDLVQIDQTQMDIVVVDEETRQSVARPRLADRLRGLSVRVGLDADAEAVIALDIHDRKDNAKHGRRCAQVNTAVSALSPV